jgi:hypothetical protein
MISSLFGSKPPSSSSIPIIPSTINKIPSLSILNPPSNPPTTPSASTSVVRANLPEEHASNPWLTDACIERYIRAAGDPDSAVKRLEATLKWRSEFKPLDFDEDEAREECGMGRVYLNGFTKAGQPLMYMICRKNGSANHERGLRWSIFLLVCSPSYRIGKGDRFHASRC